MPGDLPVLCGRGGGGGGGRQKAVDSGARARPAAAHHTAEESENTLQSVLPRRSTRTVHPSQRVLDEREIERESGGVIYTRDRFVALYCTFCCMVRFFFFTFWRVDEVWEFLESGESVEDIHLYREFWEGRRERRSTHANEKMRRTPRCT